MPELPEVERGRRMAARALVGARIARVDIARDDIVFEGASPTEIRHALEGATVQAVHRLGKQLWFELDRRPHPLFHFGMSGGFHTPVDPGLALKTGPRDPDREWPPRFWKIVVHTEGGKVLAMTDARRLGRIRLRPRPLEQPPLRDLGPDALLALPTTAVLHRKLRGRRTPIKSWLLDQANIAGIGNWLADEVLLRAGIDPRRPGADLSRPEIASLRRAIRAIVTKAVEAAAKDTDYPRGWLFHRRWGKQAGQTTAQGDPIEHLSVGGRTTAWVPNRQR